MSPFDPVHEVAEPRRCGSPSAIGPDDVLPRLAYERVRSVERARIIALKQRRRVRVAPQVVLLFECRDTVWLQVHEVLRVEGHTPRRAREELERYACLVPPPGELRATAMVDGGSRDEGRRLARALRLPGAIRLRHGQCLYDSALARADDHDEDDAVQYLALTTSALGPEDPDAELALEVELPPRQRTLCVPPGLRDELRRQLGRTRSRSENVTS